MDKYSFRPAMLVDTENVYALIAEKNKIDYGSAMMTLNNLKKRWQGDYLGTNTCVATVDGELAGYAELLDGDSPLIYLADRGNINLASKLLKNLERFDSNLWFLAHHENDIVGVALNAYNTDSNTVWVDHLGVRCAWRKRGIGKALLLHTFRELNRRDITHIMLSVDSKSLTNAPRLYESVGMKTIQTYHIYKKTISAN